MTDPIADMLARIKNALLAGHMEVVVPHSKIKKAMADILKENEFISQVKVTKAQPQSQILLKLKYVGKIPAISQVERISKPGRRVYKSAHQIPKALGGYGVTIISTSRGVMTGQTAKQKNVGGEVLCQVW